MDEDLQVSKNDYEQKEILIHDSHDDLSLSPSSLKHNNLSSNGSASSRYSQTTSHTYVNPYTEDNDAFIELHSFDFIQRMMKEVTEALVIASCENCRYRDYLSSSVPSESDFELFEYHYCSPLSSSMPVTHISYEAAEVEEHESMCNNHMEDDPNNSYDPMYSKSSDISYVNQTQVTNEKGDQNSDDEDWLAWKELADEHYGSLETHESLSEASESSYNEASNLDVNPLEVPYSIYYSSSYLGQSYGNNPYYGVVTNPCVTQTIPQSFYSMPFVMKVVGIAQKARYIQFKHHTSVAFVFYATMHDMMLATYQFNGQRMPIFNYAYPCYQFNNYNYAIEMSYSESSARCSAKEDTCTTVVGSSIAEDQLSEMNKSSNGQTSIADDTKNEQAAKENKLVPKENEIRKMVKTINTSNDQLCKPTTNTKYIVIKSWNSEDIEFSKSTGYWSLKERQVDLMNSYFYSNSTVYLIFKLKGSSCFCGYAKMTSTVKSIHDVSLKGTPFAKDKEHFQTSKKGPCCLWVKQNI
ncbi:hypothetical protein G6F49_008535 [Rhizopus delemar]|nr:hypothetical protein G6F49_008535 [Rhizopus delemar]KAG1588640.1 hypothetical protein G6F48_005145 [Rhizopus delemar]